MFGWSQNLYVEILPLHVMNLGGTIFGKYLELYEAMTPVFLPGESHGQRSLAGYSPWGRKELDMTE